MILHVKRFPAVLALLIFAQGLAAAGPLTLAEVLDRHAAAVGGREAIRSQKPYHLRSILHVGGLTGAANVWVDGARRARTDLDLSIVRQTQVLDGETGWSRDPNGVVRELQGEELDNLLSTAVTEGYRYLVLPPSRVTVRFAAEPQESAQYLWLDVVPVRGTAVQVALDTLTFLPRKLVQRGLTGRTEAYLADFRDMDGLLQAGRSMEVPNGDMAHAVEITVDKFESMEALPDSLFRRPGAAPRDWELSGGAKRVRLPAEFDDHSVFLTVRVNGSRPLRMLLDSGASTCVLDSTVAAELGLPSEGQMGAQGVGGGASFGFVRVHELRVGDAVVRDLNLITLGSTPVHQFLNGRFEGILGHDFLARFVVTVDYAGEKVWAADPGTWKPAAGDVAVPCEFIQNVPVVRASVDGLGGKFLLDLGNAGTVLLHGAIVREHRLMEKARHMVQVGVAGVGGSESLFLVRGRSFRVGPWEVRRPLVSMATATEGILSGQSNIVGNIGGWILSRFVVTLDYPHDRVWLRKGADYAKRMEMDRLGWRLSEEPTGGAWIRFAPLGTPARLAGLRERDVLSRIGAADVSRWHVEQISDLLARVRGDSVNVTVLREGAVVKAMLHLREWL